MKTVKLTQSYTVGSEVFDHVTLRDPKMRDLLELGEPFERQGGVIVEYRETIAAYVDRLVTAPAVGAVRELDLADAILVKEAVSAFFIEARMSLAKRTSSSLGLDGAQATLES